jgi:hypothetical protein
MVDTIAKIIDTIPKKFIVWIICLSLFLYGRLDGTQFTSITLGYISANIISKYTPKAKKLNS